MKKSILVASTMAAVTSMAFADVSAKVNARFGADAVTYTSSQPSKNDSSNQSGTDDHGQWLFGTDKKHDDDVTLNATGENCGASLVFTIKGKSGTNDEGTETTGKSNSGDFFTVKNYKLWHDFMDGKLRLTAGTYDKRMASNLNNDGNWVSNQSGIYKPGVMKDIGFTNAKIKLFAVDPSNITNLNGGSYGTNTVVADYKVNDKLSVAAVVFTNEKGYGQTADNNDDIAPAFVPVAFNATYALNKDQKVSFSVKEYTGKGSGSGSTAKPAYTQWAFNADYNNKNLIDKLNFEFGYTFAAALFNNSFRVAQDSYHDMTGHNESDLNEYMHGFDLRAIYTGIDKVSIQFLSNVSYKQATARNKHDKSYAGLGTADRAKYANRHAYRAEEGLDGVLAYWVGLGFDYAINPTTKFQVQTNFKNTGANNAVTKKSDGTTQVADYLAKATWTIRPGVILTPSKVAELHAGVQYTMTGWSSVHASNDIHYTVTVPVSMRLKM